MTRLIKDLYDKFGAEARCEALETESGSFRGLSCRWQPIPNANGVVVSLLVEARPAENRQIYQGVITFLHELFDGALDAANPVNAGVCRHRNWPNMVRDERRLRTRWYAPDSRAPLQVVLPPSHLV